MILSGGNYVSGSFPFREPHPPRPRAVEAVAGTPSDAYDGNLTLGPDGKVSKTVGIPQPEPFIIMVNGVNLVSLHAGVGTTAERPDPTTVSVGAEFYDTTLTIPIWSDGTIWRGADGVAA